MKVLRRNPAAARERRARTVAVLGAAVAAGTAGLMALAVGTAAAADESAGRAPAVPVTVPVPDRTTAATTVFHPAHPVAPVRSALPDANSEGTPSTTPSADPTPGS